ncbi:MAG: hypothetical protein GX839_07715, partial [Fastidiosipila sp.]|nr:hypothetical protein [Fastidiosipila sp.]
LGAIAGLTPIDGNVIVGDGSTWVAESGATARASLGLGSMATQAADAVAITGGVISGIADLAVADGGTGASDAAGARANLGLAIGADVQAHSATLDTWAGVLPSANGQSLVSAVDYAAMRGLLDLEPGTDVQAYSSRLGAIAALTPTDGNLIVGNGTTWVTQSGETARTTLGLGSMATQEAGDVAITGGAITGITDLAVTDGGTGASDAAGARGNLGFTAPILDRTAPGDIGATTPGAGTFTTLSATGIIGTPETTSSTVGVVNIGGLRIHGFRHPTGDTARPDGNNVFIGQLAGNFTMGAEATSTTHASKNTGIGYLVLDRLTTGYGNTAIGDRALRSVTEGVQNTAIGQIALLSLTTGSKNVALGYYAGRYTTGSGENQTTSNSVYIGSSTRASSDGVTNETVIGHTAIGRGSNTVQIGNSSVTDTYISGWLNLPSDTRGIKLDAAGTTTLYSDGSYLVANKGFVNPGTLVEVAKKNKSMVYGHDGTSAYLVYQPYVWGGSAWTATRGCGFGVRAIEQNTGTDCVGVGYYALCNNTGHVCAGLGAFALAGNTGDNSIGFGYQAGRDNTGNNLVALGCFTGGNNIGIHTSLVGFQAGLQNTGTQATGLGFAALTQNTGNNVVALGYRTGRYNDGSDNTFLGSHSANTFAANDSAAKAFAHTAVDPTTDRITIPAHGFGATGSYTNLKFSQGTSPITGLTSGNIYQAKIIDADTIGLNEPDGPNGTTRTIANITAAGTGTGHTFTPQHKYSNVTCVGAYSEPSASNQVTLGSTAVTEVKTSGVILPGGYKAADGSAGISKTIAFKDADNTTHTLVFKDGLLTSHTEA